MGKLPPPATQREGGRMTQAPKKYSVMDVFGNEVSDSIELRESA